MLKKWLARTTPSKDRPEYWQAYLQKQKAPIHRHTPIEALHFVVFDTETTGLNPKKDRMLSIGALRVHNHQFAIADSLDCRIFQEYQVKQEAIQIHGLLPGPPENQLSEAEALALFTPFIGNALLVGHHVAFDLAIINQALKRQLGKARLKNRLVDTRELAIRVEHIIKPDVVKPGDYTLDALCRRYHIPMSDRHTAAGDAYITAVLLLKLLHRLKKRGITNYGQLLSQV